MMYFLTGLLCLVFGMFFGSALVIVSQVGSDGDKVSYSLAKHKIMLLYDDDDEVGVRNQAILDAVKMLDAAYYQKEELINE